MTAFFINILNMSISAGIVALAVMLVRIPLKRAPKIYSYVLWGAVLFRLICPFTFESMFSFMPASSNAIPQDIIYSRTPEIESGVPFIDNSVNTVIDSVLPQVRPENSVNPIQIVLWIGGYVWLFGFAVLIFCAAVGYIRLKRRIYYATLVDDNVYETDKIQMPFVFGFIHPRIYMPVGLERAQYDYILQHEQTHIRRRDYLVKPLAFLLCSLHWFNPLVWISYVLMSKDMEMSCDEAVLRKADADIRGVYSSTLLGLSVKSMKLFSPLSFGESSVKSRIKNVLSFKKPAKWITVVSVLAVGILLAGFIPNRVKKGNSQAPDFIDSGEAISVMQTRPVGTDPWQIYYANSDYVYATYNFGVEFIFRYNVTENTIDRALDVRCLYQDMEDPSLTGFWFSADGSHAFFLPASSGQEEENASQDVYKSDFNDQTVVLTDMDREDLSRLQGEYYQLEEYGISEGKYLAMLQENPSLPKLYDWSTAAQLNDHTFCMITPNDPENASPGEGYYYFKFLVIDVDQNRILQEYRFE